VKLKNFEIVEFLAGKKAGLYTIRFKGELLSETDKFFEKYCDTLPENIDNLLLIMKNLADRYGCDTNFFKFERANQIYKLREASLRLYCIRLSNSVSIFGGGGIKDKRTTQEVDDLETNVQTLIAIQKLLDKRFSEDDSFVISNNTIKGKLKF